MKLGLYSITYLGLWYRGEALPLARMIKTAKEFGYDGIEIDGKRPHGNPLDWPAGSLPRAAFNRRRRGDRDLCRRGQQRLQLPGPRGPRGPDLLHARLDPHDLRPGCADLRVFLAWWGVTRHPKLATYDIAKGLWPVDPREVSAEEIWGWCRDALVECARYAGDAGVTLAPAESSPGHQGPSRRPAHGQ